MEKYEYAEVPVVLSEAESLDGDSEVGHTPYPVKRRSTMWWYCGMSAVIMFAIYGFIHLGVDILQWRLNRIKATTSCSCGKSVTEALAMDCKFDPIAAAWLPPACRDDELLEEFNQQGPNEDGSWSYFGDWNSTIEYTYDEVGLLADEHGMFYATLDWHIKHCTYNWRKLHRAHITGIVLDERNGNYVHIGHCEKIFQHRWPLDGVLTYSGVALNADVNVHAMKHQGGEMEGHDPY